MENASNISRDERELYDRQIRLWGLEGQTRLRNAKILVLGFEAVAVEVVKNLCLAGVGSLVLQSSNLATESDLACNFFLDKDSIGKNIVEASSIKCQRLNPRVSVLAETRSLKELGVEYISDFDVVVITQIDDREELVRIDTAARNAHCAFFYCTLNGFGGLLFVDLGAEPHEFVAERELAESEASSTVIGKRTLTQEVIDVKKPDRNAGSNTEKIRVRESYISFEDAVSVSQNFGDSLKPRQRVKVSPYLPAFLAQIENSEALTEEIIHKKTEQLHLPKSIITPEFLEVVTKKRQGIQISSMASVLGGVLSQELINFLTLREYPIQNVLVYDGLQGKGPLYFLSSPRSP